MSSEKNLQEIHNPLTTMMRDQGQRRYGKGFEHIARETAKRERLKSKLTGGHNDLGFQKFVQHNVHTDIPKPAKKMSTSLSPYHQTPRKDISHSSAEHQYKTTFKSRVQAVKSNFFKSRKF